MLKLFLAQAVSQTVWYLGMREVMAHHLMRAVTLDFTYWLLMVYAYKNVLGDKAPKGDVIAFCAGGAVGTAIGMSIPI